MPRPTAGRAVGGIAVVSAVLGSAPATATAAGRLHGSYVRVEPGPPAPAYAAGHILFLNRCPNGITVTPGLHDDSRGNFSSILTGTIFLPPYPYGDASWNAIVADVRGLFAPFGVEVTDVDPGDMPHDEAVVCGTDTAAGFEDVSGVAPLTCEPIPNAMTFTFPETIGDDVRFTAETIAQEAAHAWGLDHSYKCEDPMTYLWGCGDKSFQNGDYPCGEFEARQCYCGGGTQNTYRYIQDLFAPDVDAPFAEIVSPQDGAWFEPGDDFGVDVSFEDDVGSVELRLFVNGELMNTDDTPPLDGWKVTNVDAGDYAFYFEAEDAAGNIGTSNVVQVHVGVEEPGGDSSGDDGAPADDDDDPDDPDDPETTTPGLGPGPSYDRGTVSGCACRTEPGPTPTLSVFAIALLLCAPRRRRCGHG